MGAFRVVVKEPGPGTPEYGYCAACAQEMLDEAEERLVHAPNRTMAIGMSGSNQWSRP